MLKFENNIFSILQTLKPKKSLPKPSITSDGSHIAFGDKTDVGNFFIQLYVYSENAKLFEKGDSFGISGDPVYASFSPNKRFLAVTTNQNTFVFEDYFTNKDT